ncbi:fatty acid-binding protein-like [Amphibalanus amphitrite]|uniref:fatty acid-binding protein-like n=1 Tax=Amphibalanus amphitrite TaxID=1232801 RepID=UPI001C923394|nr:fatty acid-binding protein-like [Amphibalanus amphitrite]
MPDYNGVYKLVSSENFDEFLKAMGLNMLMRKAATSGTSTITVSVSGDHWKLKQDNKVRSNEMEFDIGVPREVKTLTGKTATTVVTKEGDTLLERRSGDGKQPEVVRHFTDSQLTVTMKLDGVTAVRVFQKQ